MNTWFAIADPETTQLTWLSEAPWKGTPLGCVQLDTFPETPWCLLRGEPLCVCTANVLSWFTAVKAGPALHEHCYFSASCLSPQRRTPQGRAHVNEMQVSEGPWLPLRLRVCPSRLFPS